MICYFYSEPSYLLFASDLPPLLYYSHIPATVLALVVGFYVFFNNPKNLLNRLLLLIALVFSSWTLINLIAWTNIHGDLILALWPMFAILTALLSILSIYFVYVFLHRKPAPFGMRLIMLGLTLPVVLLSATDLNLSGFNISDCDAFDFENVTFKLYYTGLGFVAILWNFYLLINGYIKSKPAFRKQILLMGAGMQLFLFSFITMNFLATYWANIGLVTDSDLEFYGLFGMTFFMVMIGILIVKFKAFNVGVLASQALLVSLLILVASQFTYTTTTTSTILTAITLVVTAVVGILLLRSVRKEVEQRKELEVLTDKLETANDRLKELDKLKSEFVSIASHQLRSPLTAIRGYSSLLLDGSFGKLPAQAIEPVTRIDESSKLMALSIEDYLNVSRIESGNMKYNKADFNLKEQVEHVCDGLRAEAVRKGLSLLFRSDLQSRGVVHADLGKTVQIVNNLVNNSIKYTQEGSIKVLVRDDSKKKKVYVDITDTGIGMSKKAQETIFEKFERASNANSVNATGTGLGLFVALKMAEGMGGTITVYSEGDGKGSRFTLELPLAM